jgi:hypothetical protein
MDEEGERGGARTSARPDAPKNSKAPPARDEGPKRPSYESQKLEARAIEKKKRRIAELEKSIADGEKELDSMRAKLREAPGSDWEKLAEIAASEQALQRKVDSMLMEWAKLSEEVA